MSDQFLYHGCVCLSVYWYYESILNLKLIFKLHGPQIISFNTLEKTCFRQSERVKAQKFSPVGASHYTVAFTSSPTYFHEAPPGAGVTREWPFFCREYVNWTFSERKYVNWGTSVNVKIRFFLSSMNSWIEFFSVNVKPIIM